MALLWQHWGIGRDPGEDLAHDVCVSCLTGKVRDLWDPSRGSWSVWLYLRIRGKVGSWYQTRNRREARMRRPDGELLGWFGVLVYEGQDVWGSLQAQAPQALATAAEGRRRIAARAARVLGVARGDERLCEVCGVPLIGRRSDARTCGQRCSFQRWYQRKKRVDKRAA